MPAISEECRRVMSCTLKVNESGQTAGRCVSVSVCPDAERASESVEAVFMRA